MNEWVTVKANVKDDFKKFHDLNVDELDGLSLIHISEPTRPY